MLSQGVTIVVSPLLSLIQDQVTQLIQNPSAGIPTAYLSSQTGIALKKSIYAELRRSRPSIKLLYVTAERIGSVAADFMSLLNDLHKKVQNDIILYLFFRPQLYVENAGQVCY